MLTKVIQITKTERTPQIIEEKVNEILRGPVTFRYALQTEVGNNKLLFTIFYENAPKNKRKLIKVKVFRTVQHNDLKDDSEEWFKKNTDAKIFMCTQSSYGNTMITCVFYEK